MSFFFKVTWIIKPLCLPSYLSSIRGSLLHKKNSTSHKNMCRACEEAHRKWKELTFTSCPVPSVHIVILAWTCMCTNIQWLKIVKPFIMGNWALKFLCIFIKSLFDCMFTYKIHYFLSFKFVKLSTYHKSALNILKHSAL